MFSFDNASNIFLTFKIFILYTPVFWLNVYLSTMCVTGVHRGQKMKIETLELEITM